MSETTRASVTLAARPAELRRHPIRGMLWGLMMGVGLALVLVITKVIDLNLTMLIVVVAIAILAGLLWSTIGPAKEPTGPPPATMTASTAPATSRFDDFTDPVDPDAASEPARPLETPDETVASPTEPNGHAQQRDND
jgi:hypothetical protein